MLRQEDRAFRIKSHGAENIKGKTYETVSGGIEDLSGEQPHTVKASPATRSEHDWPAVWTTQLARQQRSIIMQNMLRRVPWRVGTPRETSSSTPTLRLPVGWNVGFDAPVRYVDDAFACGYGIPRIFPMDRSDLERLLASGNEKAIIDALLSAAYYDPDWKWVQATCLRFLDHPETNVRWNAATCLGHIARIRKQLDREILVPKLTAMKLRHGVERPGCFG